LFYVCRNLDEKEFAKCMKEQKLDLTEPEVREETISIFVNNAFTALISRCPIFLAPHL